MSLFSTIAHESAAPARGFSLKGIGMMAAGLALGVGLGFIIVNRTAAESSSTAAPATALAHDDFLRLNTTSYDGLVPAASAAALETQVVVDPFIEMNTTAFDGLVPPAVIGAQNVVDPNFLYWNTDALENLAPAAAANGEKSGNVSEEFLSWNIASLEYPAARYSEQSSGPR